LVETRLARQLGTSQAPIREALRDLATLGFIETQAYKGSWVRKPSKRELVDAVQVRAELEGLAARLAAEKRSEQCIKDLEDLFEAMAAAAERGDPHDHALLNTRFHARILESSGNETLQRHWSMLEPFGRTYITASAEGIDLHWLGDRHRGILDAIRDQDADLAAEKARSHAEEVKELLENFAHPELQEEKPET
jgi:DNA-binding GntR family transcriptional regulator